jgi:hypothetical protein
MIAQHQAGTQQRVGGCFEMIGDAADKMETPRISHRPHDRYGYGALLLVGPVLNGYHPIHGFEKSLHILALAATMNVLRCDDRSLEDLGAVRSTIGERKQ